ncbi:MAG: M3 family metallopeptidase [Kiritimatiellia bacterium]
MSFLSTQYFPPFDRLTPELALQEIPGLIAETERRVAELETSCTPTWEGRIAALTQITHPLGYAWGLVSHLHSTCNSPAWRQVIEQLQPQIVALFLRIGQSEPLFAALRTLHDTPAAWNALSEGQRRVVEAELRNARDSGIALHGEERARFSAIVTRLSELGTHFSNNTLDATKAFSLILTSPEEVDGLPQNILRICADAARSLGHADATAEKGPWAVTLEVAVYGPFLKFSNRRDLRERVYRARATRACSGSFDNTPLLKEILDLRKQEATMLGFETYADLVLDSRMAKTPGKVLSLLEQIGGPALEKARKELDALRAFAAKNGQTGPLEPWDVAYWSRREMESLYGFSSETIRPYLPFSAVLEGLFRLAQELFGIAIEAADGQAPVWHPHVRLFRVRNAGGDPIAYFYLDPYSRPESKSGGAWMDAFRTRQRNADGSVQLPLALLCCNQTPPSAGRPSLMTLGEVDTLFHEFGHALQAMLTTIDFPEASGINNIEWDAVELASQFMENWCTHTATLRAISRHFETGEPIPDDLLARIRETDTYGQGLATIRQLSFGLMDMLLHTEVPSSRLPDAFAAETEAEKRYRLVPGISGEHMLATFTHIFAGGYAAGYYSYMWADILAHDAFAAFEEAGLDNPEARRETGRRYAATILGLGGARAPGDVFRDFRGRDPSPEALLRHKGLL